MSLFLLSPGSSDGLRVGGGGVGAARATGPGWLADWPTGFLADGPRCDTLCTWESVCCQPC